MAIRRLLVLPLLVGLSCGDDSGGGDGSANGGAGGKGGGASGSGGAGGTGSGGTGTGGSSQGGGGGMMQGGAGGSSGKGGAGGTAGAGGSGAGGMGAAGAGGSGTGGGGGAAAADKFTDMTASASTFNPPKKCDIGMCTYVPENVLDGMPRTAWEESVPGDGLGQWIKVEWPGGARMVTRYSVIPGYLKNDGSDLWSVNNRVRKAEIQFLPSGPTVMHEFKDEKKFQDVPLPGPVNATGVQLTIVSVYQGGAEDTLISEIEVYGKK